jgi:hypothetical protein
MNNNKNNSAPTNGCSSLEEAFRKAFSKIEFLGTRGYPCDSLGIQDCEKVFN